MRFFRSKGVAMVMALGFSLGFTVDTLQKQAYSQETTGGMQGTVKDPSGAVVPNATVTVTTPTLVGSKEIVTDAAGYYHFANLPPGTYTIVVKAQGFDTLKREGVILEVGHLPTLNLEMKVGGVSTVVEVTSQGPMIDTTTTTTLTNIPQETLSTVPHGTSFQSVIQFAPSARNEPLMGSNRASMGTGGVSPGNGSNGGAFGYSVAGGSDSENSYLVEGQETANLIGGYSHTNVPIDFIQEVQMKTSGVEAEHGGALGGVVNVIMKKGTSHYHGSLFAQYNNASLNGGPTSESRYNPLDPGTTTSWGLIDPAYQNYQPVRSKTQDFFPGFTIGGPLIPTDKWKDRLYLIAGFNPDWQGSERTVNYGPTNGGLTPFSQNTQTYYSYARLDAAVTQKIRVFGSWLYQGQRQSGENLPFSDSTAGFFNPSTGCFGAATSADNPCLSNGVPQFAYAHDLGYSAPNITLNTGGDITITNNLVSTTRFGYYFENYHDFGFPTGGQIYFWETSGLGAQDTTGADLPQSLQQSEGYYNDAYNQNFTSYNANKAIQFDEDIAFFKSGWGGTHNFKFGYQLNRLSNILDQHFNQPFVQMFVGDTEGATNYNPASDTGVANCAPFVAKYGTCQGQYGYIAIQDFGSSGKATSYNHGLFAQDAWTLGKGLTIDAGIRLDREYLPGEATGTGVPAKPINFGWGDKIAPRVGAAWDVFKNGKAKVFGSYGQFYDIMKLNLAISSFGGQYWQNCYYALDTPDLASINPVFNSANRYCVGPDASSGANFGGGTTPAGLTFLENQNFRTFPTTCSTCNASQEGVAPGLKPYKQHESAVGVDYQLTHDLAFEARWDRRRLDHVIEDSSIFDTETASETFVIVNPGQGVNSTFLGFCNFLYGQGSDACVASGGVYPPNKTIPAARSYDGVEFRLNKAITHHWAGMFSYTYSHFRGNYTGLTSSDLSDGGLGGRNSPNNSRSFDEPYFSWNSMGGSSSGLLPTDRPNALKGYAYYDVGFKKGFSMDLGLFQVAYSGTPQTTYMDIGYGGSAWPVQLFNRGTWADISQDPSTGAVVMDNPHTYRTPWYTQTDFNITPQYKIGETKAISFNANFQNIFNQHSVTAFNEQVDTGYGFQFGMPQGAGCGGTCYILNGVDFYAAAMSPYSVSGVLNTNNSQGGPITTNSQYGKPMYWQLSRNIRLGAKFTF